MKIIKKVGRGMEVPPYYGVVERDYTSDQTICAPVPLNLILAWARYVWSRLRFGHETVLCDFHLAYAQGFKKGRFEAATDEELKARIRELEGQIIIAGYDENGSFVCRQGLRDSYRKWRLLEAEEVNQLIVRCRAFEYLSNTQSQRIRDLEFKVVNP